MKNHNFLMDDNPLVAHSKFYQIVIILENKSFKKKKNSTVEVI